MSEDIKEQLSALMDGELSRDERAFLLRRLDHDSELKATWARFHLARDVITHRPGAARTDIADRVMQALAAEDRAPVAKAPSPARWRPWLGAAIAASVALMAVLSIAPQSGLDATSTLAETAPAPRTALPAGVPGPIAPSLSGFGNGVQTVSAERSTILPAAITPGQLMLLRHGQVSDASFVVGGGAQVYNVELTPAAVELDATAR